MDPDPYRIEDDVTRELDKRSFVERMREKRAGEPHAWESAHVREIERSGPHRAELRSLLFALGSYVAAAPAELKWLEGLKSVRLTWEVTEYSLAQWRVRLHYNMGMSAGTVAGVVARVGRRFRPPNPNEPASDDPVLRGQWHRVTEISVHADGGVYKRECERGLGIPARAVPGQLFEAKRIWRDVSCARTAPRTLAIIALADTIQRTKTGAEVMAEPVPSSGLF